MKTGFTKLVFVLDRSLSMKKIESYVINGLNNFFADQKLRSVGVECKVSAYKFNTQYDTIFESVDLGSITPFVTQDFQPSGVTALLDAIGTTISKVDAEINAMVEANKPDRVLIVVWTDGLENSSQTHTPTTIYNLIQQKITSGSWDFAFVSTTQDEGTVGKRYGASTGSVSDYVASSDGVGKMFDSLGKSTLQFRSGSLKSRFQFDIKRDV